jgi:hypothetical protein
MANRSTTQHLFGWRSFARFALNASMVATILAIALWLVRGYYSATFDSHRLARRYEVINSSGDLFFGWSELRRKPDGTWSLGAQAELDATFLGFGAAVFPTCGEVAVPKLAIVLVAASPLIAARIVRRRRRGLPGYCPYCGDDLHDSPGQCPGCGVVIKPTQ